MAAWHGDKGGGCGGNALTPIKLGEEWSEIRQKQNLTHFSPTLEAHLIMVNKGINYQTLLEKKFSVCSKSLIMKYNFKHLMKHLMSVLKLSCCWSSSCTAIEEQTQTTLKKNITQCPTQKHYSIIIKYFLVSRISFNLVHIGSVFVDGFGSRSGFLLRIRIQENKKVWFLR